MRTQPLILALLLLSIGTAGCTKVGLRKPPAVSASGIQGQPALGITAGGSITSDKQTSIGLATKGGVFTSPHYRAMIGMQGSLYSK